MTTANHADVEMSLAQMAKKWGVGEKTLKLSRFLNYLVREIPHALSMGMDSNGALAPISRISTQKVFQHVL